MNVQPIYRSNILKKGLKFAANRSCLFVGAASFVMSSIVRPISIMATPKTDLQNKKYACTKSIASSIVGYLIMLGASLPVSNALKNIFENPNKYINQKTIKFLQAGEKSLKKSKRFMFATQLFDLGLGLLIAVPKSMLTCALIPPLMSKIFPKKGKNKNNKEVSFKGLDDKVVNKLSKKIGSLMGTDFVKNMSKKFCNTNFEQHIMSLTDVMATGAFVAQVEKNKKIETDRKKALIYNAEISTGLSIAGGYALNGLLKKPTEKFIANFKKANKNSAELETYIKGIRVAKPALILGGIYYTVIPLISTFASDKFSKK